MTLVEVVVLQYTRTLGRGIIDHALQPPFHPNLTPYPPPPPLPLPHDPDILSTMTNTLYVLFKSHGWEVMCFCSINRFELPCQSPNRILYCKVVNLLQCHLTIFRLVLLQLYLARNFVCTVFSLPNTKLINEERLRKLSHTPIIEIK